MLAVLSMVGYRYRTIRNHPACTHTHTHSSTSVWWVVWTPSSARNKLVSYCHPTPITIAPNMTHDLHMEDKSGASKRMGAGAMCKAPLTSFLLTLRALLSPFYLLLLPHPQTLKSGLNKAPLRFLWTGDGYVSLTVNYCWWGRVTPTSLLSRVDSCRWSSFLSPAMISMTWVGEAISSLVYLLHSPAVGKTREW